MDEDVAPPIEFPPSHRRDYELGVQYKGFAIAVRIENVDEEWVRMAGPGMRRQLEVCGESLVRYWRLCGAGSLDEPEWWCK